VAKTGVARLPVELLPGIVFMETKRPNIAGVEVIKRIKISH
jgi:hypothetical protein